MTAALASTASVTDDGSATHSVSVIASDGSGQSTIKADSVMIAVGYLPNKCLYDSAKSAVPEAHAIGDCVDPRKLINAIWEGFGVARVL